MSVIWSEDMTAERVGMPSGHEKKGSQSKLKRYVQRGRKIIKSDTIAQ